MVFEPTLQESTLCGASSYRRNLAPLLPLNYFEQRFVVDLKAQISKPDGQMPTVYLPQFFGHEFTEKIAPHELLAIPKSIGVYRLDGTPRAKLTPTWLAPALSPRYRQRLGRHLGDGVAHFHCCLPARPAPHRKATDSVSSVNDQKLTVPRFRPQARDPELSRMTSASAGAADMLAVRRQPLANVVGTERPSFHWPAERELRSIIWIPNANSDEKSSLQTY